MKLKQYRQGDVFLVKIAELPAHADEVTASGRIVLAYGEVTGHAHAISAGQARMFVDGDTRFLVVESSADLCHEEHATIQLESGVYRIVQQREYVPNSSRLVID